MATRTDGAEPDGVASAEHSISSSCEEEAAGAAATSYQEHPRFCTWRKHVRDLYQQLFHIDLVWESCVAQFMPYVTPKSGTTTHTILCGTRTNGQEQNFIQLLNVTLPSDTASLDNTLAPFCEATGEVGGYGMSPHQCGLKVERRILHDGDVLAARYMPANPLLLASCSSNGSVYVFDWSRVSLNRYPNDPPRPRAPLPPNALTHTNHASSSSLVYMSPSSSSSCPATTSAHTLPTEEEKAQYHRRMRELHAVIKEQDRWDRRSGDGQHVLTLRGGTGASDSLDWSVHLDGWLASGSRNRLCVWQVAHMSKEDARSVDALHTLTVRPAAGADEAAAARARVTGLTFGSLPHSPFTLVYASSAGVIAHVDVRTPHTQTEITSLAHGCRPTALALSPHESSALLVGSCNGVVRLFDMRRAERALRDDALHTGEVTGLAWCPHSRHLFASAGEDGTACVYNQTRERVLFRHLGHTDSVMDVGWNWQEGNAGQLVTVDSNALMIWRPRDYFFYI